MRMVLWAALALSIGCGAKSGLAVPEDLEDGLDASTVRPRDASGLDAPIGRDAPRLRDSAAPDAPEACPLAVTFSEEPPMIVLILDRSGSMNINFRRATLMFPSASRWVVIGELLVGTAGGADGLVSTLRARVGLLTFTTGGGQCPLLRWVPPAFNNLVPLRQELLSTNPVGGTPTAEAILDATARVPANRLGNEAVAFVLATDGEPNGCGVVPGGRAGVVAAVQQAYAQDIRTYVVSVGDDTALDHLQEVANAGLGIDPATGMAEFWNGRSPARLADALQQAASRATSCVGVLSRPIRDLSRACEIEASVDDETFVCDDFADGYRFPDDRHIELFGAACNLHREDTRRLALDAPCDLL